jgi:hypothetical protein
MRVRRSRQERQTLLVILLAAGLPTLLAGLLVTMDLRSDLSDLTAAKQSIGEEPALVGWADLASLGSLATVHGGPVKMIGYMMDGEQPSKDRSPVSLFVLMPEAGQFLHPSRPEPDQMVEVRTKTPVAFHFQQLVWATGTLSRTTGRDRDRPAWAISDAEVQPAQDREIMAWFRR